METEQKKNKLLILIRHGERCDYGGAVPHFGKYDPELTEKGKQLAFETGKMLSKTLIEKYGYSKDAKINISSSPFIRTLQTTRELIKGFQSEKNFNIASTINVDCNLCEVCEFKQNYPKDFLSIIKQGEDFKKEFENFELHLINSYDILPTKDETYDDCGVRLKEFLKWKIDSIVDKEDSDVTIFISHAEPINQMNMVLGYPGPFGWPHITYCKCVFYNISKETKKVSFIETASAE